VPDFVMERKRENGERIKITCETKRGIRDERMLRDFGA